MGNTGLIWANMLRAFHVGKALTSDKLPSSWMRFSRVAWGPCELTGVPFDEGLCVRGDAEVLVDARGRLADLGVSKLDE